MDQIKGLETGSELPAAVAAFDGVAPIFDSRFGEWLSVAAQRDAVRRHLLRVFPVETHLLELGGGTAEDAIYMGRHGRRVLMTDGSPAMISHARSKIADNGLSERVSAQTLTLEQLPDFKPDVPFDGVFSNFASLNCVSDLRPVGASLARVVRPHASAVFVLFGKRCIAEMLLHMLRREPRVAFRRFASGAVDARINKQVFHVWYPSIAEVQRAMSPWFRLRRIRGIGVFVPPSAAEPGISKFPRLVQVLKGMDKLASVPLARVADHVLFDFVRTENGS